MPHHDVLIMSPDGSFPDQLREALGGRNFATQVVASFEEALEILPTVKRPILLVHTGPDERLVRQAIQRLEAHVSSIFCPLLFATPNAAAATKLVNPIFPLVTVIEAPCSQSELLSSLSYISRAYYRLSNPRTNEAEPPLVPLPLTATPAAAGNTDPAPAPEVAPHQLYQTCGSIPGLFFNQLERLQRLATPLGGAAYRPRLDEAFLREGGFFPSDPRISGVFESIATAGGAWARGHLCRLLYVSQQILTALESPLLEPAKTAALLYPWSFADQDADLLRMDLTHPGGGMLRKEVASRTKDSGMRTALELGAAEAGNLIALMGRIIGREQGISDDPACLAASTLVACNQIDRICFLDGHWNPRRAYRLLRHLKSSPPREMHPLVLCCIVKFLSEAITLRAVRFVLPLKVRKDKDLAARARAHTEILVEPYEMKVGLAELSPGMRLSRPLICYDGREILGRDLTLDQDLIWRLWQLCAIRPLNAPVIVLRP